MSSGYYSGFLPPLLFVLILLSIFGMLYSHGVLYQENAGMKQPIPFSHKWHAGVKKIGCVMCHEGALKTANAGIPSGQTCMLCHEKIAIHFLPIREVRAMYENNIPVEWLKVYYLPDFVKFDHSVHTSRAIDCGKCHGNVAGMDRVTESQKLEMGFCIQCHRENEATTDCFACHY